MIKRSCDHWHTHLTPQTRVLTQSVTRCTCEVSKAIEHCETLELFQQDRTTLHRKILANHTGKSYWRGQIWRISYSQCICHMCEYWQGKFWRIAQDSQFTNFSLSEFSHVQNFNLITMHLLAYIWKSQTQSSDSWPDAQTGHPHTSDCHRMNTGTFDPLPCVCVCGSNMYEKYTVR